MYTYLGSRRHLVLPLSELDKVCTQFKENTAIHIHLGGLVRLYIQLAKKYLMLPSSVTKFGEVGTQF